VSPFESFLWGFGGSIAVEIVALNDYWNAGRGRLPARYKNGWFWLCRVLLAGIGGGLTVAYGITANRLLAVNIGVATPLIIQAFGRRVAAQLPGASAGTDDTPG
jgi:hypothetical protein